MLKLFSAVLEPSNLCVPHVGGLAPGGRTLLLLFLSSSAHVAYQNSIKNPTADLSNTSDSIYIACGFGFALLVAAWLFFRVTGALFNPNIATALVILGVIKPLRYLLFVIAHLLGAISAAAVVEGLMPGPPAITTVPIPLINKAQAVFIEMFATAFLTFSVLMLGVEKHRATPFAPVGVGITLFACHLWALPLTGASLNTARSFGPAVITHFERSQWVYWLGPTLGAILATVVYLGAKTQEYWTLAPDQDAIDNEKSPSTNVPLTRSGSTDPMNDAENGTASRA